ncbi:MAG: hypothetical protein Q8Q24_02395 [bacterium]|nr:hypothetical protein [bacterium]
MKYLLLFLLVIILAFAQSFLGFNFVLGLLLVLSLSLSPKSSLVIAFLSGVVLDLFAGSRLGFSSLGFILPVFFIILYRQRFSFKNPVWLGLIAVGSYLWFAWLLKMPVNLIECFVLAALVTAFRWFLPQQEQLSLKI